MTVKKKMIRSVDAFIDKGADVKSGKHTDFKNVLIRMPVQILTQIDEAISRKPWLNRTQLILSAIHEKLKDEETE